MKFSCQTKSLKKALNQIEKVIPKQSTLAVLQNLFLSLKNNELTLRGNDLELGIENKISVQDGQDGDVLIQAKTLSDIMSRLQSESIDVTIDEQFTLALKAGDVNFKLLGLDAESYPAFPEIIQEQVFSINVGDLLEMIKQTIVAVSFDETKKFFNGILISMEENNLNFTATDGFRLALKSLTLPGDDTYHIKELIIPYKAVSEVARLLSSYDHQKIVNVALSQTQISFSCDDLLIISRLITGKFPDTKNVIPSSFSHQIKIPRLAFLQSCERASIIAASANDIFKITFKDSNLAIEAKAASLGDFKEVKDVTVINGSDEVSISFNIKLVIDFLRTVEHEEVVLSFNNAVSPCQFSIENDQEYTYIVMPIRTHSF